jgi:hypothetical protein
VATQPLGGLDPTAGESGADATPAQVRPAAAMVIGFVAVHLGGPAPPPPAGHPDRWDVVQHRLQHGRVVRVGRAENYRQRQAASIAGQVQLGPLLAAIDRVCAGQVPPLTARRLKLSMLTRPRSMPPARPARWPAADSRAWSCGAMNTSAATQLRSGTRRGTPPRGRDGGDGCSGWMRRHSPSDGPALSRIACGP